MTITVIGKNRRLEYRRNKRFRELGCVRWADGLIEAVFERVGR